LTWWRRIPVLCEFEARELNEFATFERMVSLATSDSPLVLTANLLVRPEDAQGNRFCTLAIRNETPAPPGSSVNQLGLFQTEFSVRGFGADGEVINFTPYPDRANEALKSTDSEIASIELLYRDQKTYAVGHGCSGDWRIADANCNEILGTFFPTFEAPSITPLIVDAEGKSLEVKMSDLMDCSPGSKGVQQLEHLVDEYGAWIEVTAARALHVDAQHQRAAFANLDACRTAHRRMRAGLQLLRDDSIVRRAFELANEAVLFQQGSIPRPTRKLTWNKKGRTFDVGPATPTSPSSFGSWRPFQIGFVLTALASTLDGSDQDRTVVDLIFFPTGGGKTEAYQALIAISLFTSRLRGTTTGVEVFMRYTLRLLTAQQFLRAASLIASMEKIRSRERLGTTRFTIGIWVGRRASPNTRKDAKERLSKLRRSNDKVHPFVLTRCPLCSTSLGPVEGDAPKSERWPGLQVIRSRATHDKETVAFLCPNGDCEFSDESNPIPAFVIDEDIFEVHPSLVIATLDKFANVAFNEDIRWLFGIDNAGKRICNPPNLIIQDELHLISGPLGSVSGIYETLFEAMCVLDTALPVVLPKIVCSTATIRSASSQILGLYARDSVSIFPPSGIDAGDSFFAKYAMDGDSLAQGQMFVGVLGTSLGSVQDLQTRVATALLQAPMSLPEDLRDSWSTNLAFFNRIQDIGTSFSLLRINARAMLKTLWQRKGIRKTAEKRFINDSALMELTSRISSDQLSSSIERLATTYPNGQVDICLASNIIEVGIDVQRLSLMTMLGQPKTASQYIQVAGRVGRDWKNRPGLVVVQYPPRRPRDRSHFEKFRSFHQRLYGSVEPTSVTPWSTPVMERALHAVIIGHVRNANNRGLSPTPFPEELFDNAVDVARNRIAAIEPHQLGHFEALVERRREEWREWRRSNWGGFVAVENPLMNLAGKYLDPQQRLTTWETMSSMRNVDAMCNLGILPNALLGGANE
jgi:hypothetical protein